MATPTSDPHNLPAAASERGWERTGLASRETLREWRLRGFLTAVYRPGRRRLVILRDGPGGVLDCLERFRVAPEPGAEDDWARRRVDREEGRP